MNAETDSQLRKGFEKSTKEWWKGAVYYQIYPRSFFDSNNDWLEDLQGMIKELPYVASLGVDAVWISPFFKSPMKDGGYEISNYRDVTADFGTMLDFEDLRVIL